MVDLSFSKCRFIAALEQVVKRYPQSVAVSELSGRRLTYEALWQRSLSLTYALREAGCCSNQLVAVQITKSCDFVVALMGVWLAGCAFMVLDPQQPRSRLVFMCDEAKPDFLLFGVAQTPVWSGACSIAMGDIDICPRQWSEVHTGDSDMAYLLYTSGSSGKPKGVRVSHQGIFGLLQAQIKQFELSPGQRSLWLHSIGFDASLSDIGTALLSGARLCIIPDYTPTSTARLFEYIEQMQINFIDMPPALLQWMDPASCPDCLQTLVVGGEVCPAAVLVSWAKHKRVILVYGPTEATICTSMIVVDPEQWSGNGIGFPLSHVEYRLSAEADEPDNQGELLIGGNSLALGYLNRYELEKQKFIYLQQRRYYATGDRVHRHDDGSFEFLGRTDRQVKVHGKLVAPEEIEFWLASHPSVRQAVVVPWAVAHSTRLIAYVEVAEAQIKGKFGALEFTLRRWLEHKLPLWMIPNRIYPLQKIPLNQHQKVDLNYLTVLAQTGQTTTAPIDWEGDVQQLFCQVLGQSSIDGDADFFQLGGDSVSVIAMLSLAQSKGIPISAEMLYQHKTINGINQHLATEAIDGGALSSQQLTQVAMAQIDQIALDRIALDEDPTPGDILLTGATGFFGSYLLFELLRQTQGRIHCLVRGDEGLMKAKLVAAVSQHGLSLGDKDWQRIGLVYGDLQKHRFGWSDKQWDAYSRRVGRLYHCGAETSLIKPFETLKATNVEGTTRVIQFAVTGRKKALHYVSTLSVFVDASPKPVLCLESDRLQRPVEVYGGYAQSKWVAEKMLHLFAPNIAQLSIYRLGLLTARLDGGQLPPQDWFSLILKYGSIPPEQASDELLFDFTPVDFAARSLVYISNNIGSGNKTFHIANPQPVSAAQLALVLTDENRVDPDNERSAVDIHWHLGEELKGRAVQNPRTLFKRTATDFEMNNTQTFIAPTTIRAPIISARYLKQYCKKVKETG